MYIYIYYIYIYYIIYIVTFDIEINKRPKFTVGDYVRISKYKRFCQRLSTKFNRRSVFD